MMHDMAIGSAMMWGMSIFWVLVIALVLGIAALTKFLLFDHRGR